MTTPTTRLLSQALAMGARELDFVFVNSLGNVYKVARYTIGSYGSTVYRIQGGALVRQTWL